MNFLKTLGLSLTTSAVLAGCGAPAPEGAGDSVGARASALLTDKSIVEPAAPRRRRRSIRPWWTRPCRPTAR
jgi:hypothetical protein